MEKGMATHSSILAWKIPWTEEPGQLQTMGLQRVGYDWAATNSCSRSLACLDIFFLLVFRPKAPKVSMLKHFFKNPSSIVRQHCSYLASFSAKSSIYIHFLAKTDEHTANTNLPSHHPLLVSLQQWDTGFGDLSPHSHQTHFGTAFEDRSPVKVRNLNFWKLSKVTLNNDFSPHIPSPYMCFFFFFFLTPWNADWKVPLNNILEWHSLLSFVVFAFAKAWDN